MTKTKAKKPKAEAKTEEVFYIVEDKNGFWISNAPAGKKETQYHGPVSKAEAEILLSREIGRCG